MASRVLIWFLDRSLFIFLLLYYEADHIRTIFKVRIRDTVPQSLPPSWVRLRVRFPSYLSHRTHTYIHILPLDSLYRRHSEKKSDELNEKAFV
jgi:hypothetical protein